MFLSRTQLCCRKGPGLKPEFRSSPSPSTAGLGIIPEALQVELRKNHGRTNLQSEKKRKLESDVLIFRYLAPKIDKKECTVTKLMQFCINPQMFFGTFEKKNIFKEILIYILKTFCNHKPYLASVSTLGLRTTFSGGMFFKLRPGRRKVSLCGGSLRRPCSRE